MIKKFLFTLIILLLFSGCIYRGPKDSILNYIQTNCNKNIEECLIDFNSIITFEWDKLFIKGLGLNDLEIVDILGEYYDEFCLGCGQFIFYKDNEIVHVEDYYIFSFSEDKWDLNVDLQEEQYLMLKK